MKSAHVLLAHFLLSPAYGGPGADQGGRGEEEGVSAAKGHVSTIRTALVAVVNERYVAFQTHGVGYMFPPPKAMVQLNEPGFDVHAAGRVLL